MLDEFSFLSREELLGGLPARQASTLLFAIESRTARLAGQSRQAMALFAIEESVQERESVFLEALAEGRESAQAPTIQDLERYALGWASLVPENPNVRAAVAKMIGEKYEFTEALVPDMRATLGLDDDVVQDTYERLYSEPLQMIYVSQVRRVEQWRWRLSGLEKRLEALPPFWITFISTIMGTLGSGILALPIALAKLGPLVGVALLLILGLVNVLTIAYMAEAVARNGSIRYGSAFVGQVVSDYLGRAGSFIFSLMTAIFCFVTLLSFYIGVSRALTTVTNVPAAIWIALLFLVGLYFLRSESLTSTVASALVINAINICLVIMLTLLAFTKLQAENLMYMNIPFVGGTPFDPSILELVFGVILFIFAGHISVANSAKLVIRRDPSGRSLILGGMAGLATVMTLYCVWTIAVGGAIAPQILLGQSGTVLEPLAEIVGPSVHLLGTLYIVLAMGLGSIHYSIGLFHLVYERIKIPASSPNGERRRFYLSLTPIVLLFLLTEWFVLTDTASFTALIGFGGVIAAPLFAGVFPILLLVASRRKGDHALSGNYPFLGHPALLIGAYLLFVSSLFLHGLVIWQGVWLQGTALLIGLLIVAATISMIRRGIFKPRLVVELRKDLNKADNAYFAITAAGQPLSAKVRLHYPSGEQQIDAPSGQVARFRTLRSLTFQIPSTSVRELKVWVHQITAEGVSERWPMRLEAHFEGNKTQEVETPSNGQLHLPLSGACQLVMTPEHASSTNLLHALMGQPTNHDNLLKWGNLDS